MDALFDWERFRATLEKAWPCTRHDAGPGRPSWDAVCMSKVLVVGKTKGDVRRRRWHARDWEKQRVYVECDIPRVDCSEHGYRQVAIPWAEPRLSLTRSLEQWIIEELAEKSVDAGARHWRR